MECVLLHGFFHVCFNQYRSTPHLHPPISLCLLSLAVMPRFTEQVESAVEALSANPSQPVDENEFIDASRLVYDGIRDIRKAVLMIRVSCIVLLIYLPQQRTSKKIFSGIFALLDVLCVSRLAAFSFQS